MIGNCVLGLLAIVPLAIGPLPAKAQSLTAQMCGGGSIEIPIEREGQPETPCTAKACHSGSCRKRFDLAQ